MDFFSIIDKVRKDERITDSELEMLLQWLSSAEGKAEYQQELQNRWEEYDTDRTLDYDSILRKIHRRKNAAPRKPKGRTLRRRFGRIAAVALPLLAAGSLWLYLDRTDGNDGGTMARVANEVTLILPDGSEIVMDRATENSLIAEQGSVSLIRENGRLIHENHADGSAADMEFRWGAIEVPRGAQFDMMLEDGTQVWLNAGSRIRFPLAFHGEERRVYLEGEAYFKVRENSVMPFVVETSRQDVTVLGTEFNIYSYADEQTAYTTLVSGSVRLTTAQGGETVLSPGQQARLEGEEAGFTVENVDVRKIIAWRNGEFVFEGISLDNVFERLKRWYNFEYEFEDAAVAGLTMRGSVPVYDDMGAVLDMIEASGVARIVLSGNKIIIKKAQ